jgi:biopolymer transport protein ExbD
MDLKSRNKVEATFSMASMTDLIFLLLVFFMLTSSFITPSGLPVSLPSSKSASVEMQKVSVTVTKDINFYVNDKQVTRSTLEAELKSKLNKPNGSIILHVDKTVPVEHLAFVAGIATSLEAKVILAVQPQK